MAWTCGIDEIGSETQLSDGWTIATLPTASVASIDAALAGCAVKTFHGKKFKQAQAEDYELFLRAVRKELLNHQDAHLTFSLLSKDWRSEFSLAMERIVSGGFRGAGVEDPTTIAIAEHLFPGLATLQRLTSGTAIDEVSLEVDSDDISKLLRSSSAAVSSRTVESGKLLKWGYEAYRRSMFPTSPKLADIAILKDGKSRAIQAADVFGNFALSYMFAELGHSSAKRAVKAQIFASVFAGEISPNVIHEAAALGGPTGNDIVLAHSGGLTLRVGS